MRPSRVTRFSHWLMVVAVAGVLPGFFMRCDKAALDFQRGLFEGLGLALSEAIIDTGLLGVEGD